MVSIGEDVGTGAGEDAQPLAVEVAQLADRAPVPPAVLGAVGQHGAVRARRRPRRTGAPTRPLRAHGSRASIGERHGPAQQLGRGGVVEPAAGEPLERRLVAGRGRDPGAGAVERQVGGDDLVGRLDQEPGGPQASERSAPCASSCVARPPSRRIGSPCRSASRKWWESMAAWCHDTRPVARGRIRFAGADQARAGRIPCATGGCRSRRSRPSSWATAASGATSRRAPCRDASLGDLGAGPRGAGAPVRRPPRPAGAAGRDRRQTRRARSRTTSSSTPGAVAALFIVHTTLLEPGDHIVVARPNYATNVETPRAIGADVTYLDLDLRGRLGGGPGADRRAADAADEARQPHHAAQPHRRHPGRGRCCAR